MKRIHTAGLIVIVAGIVLMAAFFAISGTGGNQGDSERFAEFNETYLVTDDREDFLNITLLRNTDAGERVVDRVPRVNRTKTIRFDLEKDVNYEVVIEKYNMWEGMPRKDSGYRAAFVTSEPWTHVVDVNFTGDQIVVHSRLE